MKREFTVPVTVVAHTKEEAQSQVNLLLQLGAFLNDFNVQNLAGSFMENFLLSRLSRFTEGTVDLSRCYQPTQAAATKPIPNGMIKRKRRQRMNGQN